jgi:chromosome segregation ATPase
MTTEASRSNDQPPLWPLTEIGVAGLFGDRTFSMPLVPSATILTGENGSGKSTVLRAIHLLALERWRDFADLPLRGLTLSFAGGEQLVAEVDEAGVHFESGQQSWTFDREAAEQIDPRLLNELSFARRALPVNSARRQRELARQRELMRRHDRVVRHAVLSAEEMAAFVTPDWLSDLTARFQTKLISARRLEHRLRPDPAAQGEDTPVPVVEQYAQALRDRMRDQLSAYAAESRRQEKNLPARIVQAMQGGSESAEALAQDVDRLRKEVRRVAESLARVGLFQGGGSRAAVSGVPAG